MFGPINLYQYGYAKSKMMGAIVFLFFLVFVCLFFFDVEPCRQKQTLTKSIKLNFLAKLKAENQSVDLNFKPRGTIFNRGLYQHNYLYQHTSMQVST